MRLGKNINMMLGSFFIVGWLFAQSGAAGAETASIPQTELLIIACYYFIQAKLDWMQEISELRWRLK